MGLLRHIQRCNLHDPTRYVPLTHAGTRLGRVKRENAAMLARFPAIFAVTPEEVRIVAPGGFAELSRSIDGVVEQLVAEGELPKWRNEFFAVSERWGAEPRFKLDRGAIPFFGVRAYGVHLNGWRHDAAGRLMLWIGRRAPDKKVAPNQLDNLVAGGIGYDHGLFATLEKEAQEEAALPRELIARAVPVGALSYRMQLEHGQRDDVLFLYDLEVPADFVPRNTDGEIVEFTLMEAREAVERVRNGEEFKFNVNLVIIDFALRHGLVTAEDPEYLDLVTGLRRPLD